MSIKLRSFLLFIFVVCGTALLAQPGEWGDLLSYNQSVGATYNTTEVVNYTRSSLLRYNFRSGERRKLSKLNRLSDAGIRHASLSPEGELWISYASGRVEHHFADERREAFTDLEAQVLEGLRTSIHQLQALDGDACLGISTDYVYYFADGKLARAFRLWGTKQSIVTLHCVATHNGQIYIGTSQGVYVSGNGVGAESYVKQEGLSGKIVLLASDGDELIAVRSLSVGYELWKRTSNQVWTKVAERPTSLPTSISYSHKTILVAEPKRLLSINVAGEEEVVYDDALHPAGAQLGVKNAFYAPDGVLYVSSCFHGLLPLSNGIIGKSVTPASPAFVLSSRILPLGERKLVLVNGEVDENTHSLAEGAPLFYYQSENDEGTNIYWDKQTSVTDVALLNASSQRFAVATSNEGLLIFEGEKLVTQYTSSNSPLPSQGLGTSHLNALTVGEDGTLYICAGMAGKLFRLSPDGSWSKGNLPTLFGRSELQLVPSKKGQLFIIGNTLSELIAIAPSTFFSSNGAEGIASQNLIGEQMSHITTGRSMGFDSNGDLWIGTDDGLVRVRTPEQLLDSKRITFSAVYIYVDKEQNALLEKVRIDHLVVDAGDRLWTYSPNKGIMHIDPNKRYLLAMFVSNQSPLPSNWISSLSYEAGLGILYIGTDLGVVSLVTSANSAEKDYNSVRIYPNPVRPDFTGLLTLDGLVKDSYIKIVDSSGNLVRELQSNGGRATWDLRNGAGHYVASGIYYVLISNETSKQGYAGKFVVIR